jgi:ureidoglycolate dehydrogenase (NAD+)
MTNDTKLNEMTITIEEARGIIRGVLAKFNLSDTHMERMEKGLIETSLKGIDTHGFRLLPLYEKELRLGRSNAKPEFKWEDKTESISHLDADAAPGIIAGYEAVEKCIEIAKKHGVGIVTVSNSNHFGAASVYGDEIANAGMIGFATTNAAPRVVPFGGKEKLYGTDPICFTAPMKEEGELFSLDMATSQISYSKVKEYRKMSRELESGWGVNESGEGECNPDLVSGLSTVGGYKGQGLSMMTQILSTILSGAPMDHQLSHLDQEPYNEGRQIGHFFMAIDINKVLPLNVFESRMQEMANVTRNSQAIKEDQPVIIPGDKERLVKQVRLKRGISLNPIESNQLNELLESNDLKHLIQQTNESFKS